MNEMKPTAAALRAAIALIRDASKGKTRNQSDTELMAQPITHKVARIIDHETACPQVEELIKAANAVVSEFLEMSEGRIEFTPKTIQKLSDAAAKANPLRELLGTTQKPKQEGEV